jgi:hypothetical protein
MLRDVHASCGCRPVKYAWDRHRARNLGTETDGEQATSHCACRLLACGFASRNLGRLARPFPSSRSRTTGSIGLPAFTVGGWQLHTPQSRANASKSCTHHTDCAQSRHRMGACAFPEVMHCIELYQRHQSRQRVLRGGEGRGLWFQVACPPGRRRLCGTRWLCCVWGCVFGRNGCFVSRMVEW